MQQSVAEENNRSTPKKVLRLPQVIQKTGLSRATIYAYIKKGQFPGPFQLSERSVGWLESSIDTWIDDRIARGREI